jgi:hypothetical protein
MSIFTWTHKISFPSWFVLRSFFCNSCIFHSTCNLSFVLKLKLFVIYSRYLHSYLV